MKPIHITGTRLTDPADQSEAALRIDVFPLPNDQALFMDLMDHALAAIHARLTEQSEGSMTDTERHDPLEAAKHAQTHQRNPSAPPHHLRCDWIKGDFDAPGPRLRCKLGDGHQGDHVYA